LRHFISIHGFGLELDGDEVIVDVIFAAITKLTLLAKVQYVSSNGFEEGGTLVYLPSEPLKGLFTNLQELTLGEFNLDNQDLKDVARALAHCRGLRRFKLHVEPSRTLTCLISLTLLANALKTNTTLEAFELEFLETCPKLDSFLIEVADALTSNSDSALKKFKVQSPVCYGTSVEDAFVKLLHSNYTLHKVDFLTVETKEEDNDADDDDNADDANADADDERVSKRTKIELFLHLNKRGRKNLLSGNGVSRAKWLDTFANDLTNDFDALHYYVRVNPWLCCVDDDPLEPKTKSRQEQQLQQQQQHMLQEMKKLNSKMDDMKEHHKRQKIEVLRLKEDVLELKVQSLKERYWS
jgi:hypothetical protein